MLLNECFVSFVARAAIYNIVCRSDVHLLSIVKDANSNQEVKFYLDSFLESFVRCLNAVLIFLLVADCGQLYSFSEIRGRLCFASLRLRPYKKALL